MDKEQIKKSLSIFINESLDASQIIGLRDGTKVKLNQALYEIQHHLAEELRKCDLNVRLNERISSDSIIKSFSQTDHSHHKAEHYAFPFLKYVYDSFRVDVDLLTYIDDFIEENREQLSWRDIVLTKTGATRCKTNVRFSLNLLRDLGLVRRRDKKDKRTMLPTVIGQLIVLYFDWLNRALEETLTPEISVSFHGYVYFVGHLERLHDPIVLTGFLGFVKGKFVLDDVDRQKIDKYINDFIRVILPSLSISEKGIKYDPAVKKSADYKSVLSELSNDYLFLKRNDC